jgi:hypothetical protein
MVFKLPVHAQVEGEDTNRADKDTVMRIDERRFIYHGNIYRENSPYLTLGYGVGRNIAQDTIEQNLIISYHHFIKGVGMGIGYHTSKPNKVWWRENQTLVDFYLSVGKRWEGTKYNLAFFAGPSYVTGGYVAYVEALQEKRYFPIRTVGGIAEATLTYRFTYDLGVGISAYTSINKFIQTIGVQAHLFFSLAYVRSYD